jgi:predicted membrane-bound dolichyl-phosphate-mannose-protein mannosyltransferase
MKSKRIRLETNEHNGAADPLTVQEPLGKGFKPYKSPIDARDKWIMLLIALIYAVVAYVNLGSFTAPETQCKMNETVIIKLEEPSNIGDIRYYAGIGEGTIQFEYSTDGEAYYPVTDTEGKVVTAVEYKNSEMYVWRITKTSIHASYIKIDVIKPGMNINEIAVFDTKGNRLPLNSALLQGVVFAENMHPQNLIDEQDIVPAQPSYMDEMYFDEIYHGRTAYEEIHHLKIYEITHPPLGKDIMTIGLHLFGMTPFGWRCVGTLFGVLMLPLIYIFAKSLFKKRRYAVFAAILMAADFMHFSQTRIGTIDSYSVFFIMLMMLFMYYYTQHNFNFQPLKKTLLPLFLCGLAFGLGAATKWLCIYAGSGLVAVFIYTMLRRRREYKIALQDPDNYPELIANYKKNVAFTILWCILFFIVIPGAIYLLSYIPYTQAHEPHTYGFKEILENQKYMLNYHANLNPDKPHPFASMWYTWPLDIRPLLFYSNQTEPGVVSTMSTMGNPLIWIGGFIASVWFIILAVFKKYRSRVAAFLGICALSQFIPWTLVSREVFIYHYFATTPFLILLLVLMLKRIDEKYGRGKRVTMIYVIACVAAFAFFYPVISGTPVSAEYIPFIRWLPSWPFY